MYRVAVIQNESEMMRSGYTNIIPKLRNIKRMSSYSFEMFNVVNIHELFHDGENQLSKFDSLFISTNATSDKAVLNVFRDNKKHIEDFINNGKGVFVSSQKKLSTDMLDLQKDNGKTQFLPDLYEFYTVVRPKVEKDSGQGVISVFEKVVANKLNNDQHILLQHPQFVTAEETMRHCEKNEFQRHFYRSHLIPQVPDSYSPILIDTSYEDVKFRNLLMANSISHNGERVVISTIVIDWEFHEDLLTNVICYITEGLPKVAFIEKAGVKNGDFDFLLTTATLSKVPYEIYNDVSRIKKELYDIHNTYIFSPDWKEHDVSEFISKIGYAENGTSLKKPPYRRVYYFKRTDNELTLNQYSNFSTIDFMIDRAVLWLGSKFENAMWGGSFWTTYDVLMMMVGIGVDIDSYIYPAINDIKKHYKEGSYDGVMGATCGLLELIIQIEKNCGIKITDMEIKEILGWIAKKYSSQSNFDKQIAVLSMDKLKSEIINRKEFEFDENKFAEMKNDVCNVFHTDFFGLDSYTEMDICKNISVCILCGNRDRELAGLLDYLWKSQSPDGKWTSTARTAHVLVFLLKNLDVLKNKSLNSINIDDMIYNGILYLRSQYNWKLGNWDNDILATAKATQAIGLYNDLYKYSTQDFFNTLDTESDKIYSASVIRNVSDGMRKMRLDLADKQDSIVKLKDKSVEYQSKLDEFSNAIENYKSQEEFYLKEGKRVRVIAITSAGLLIGLVFSLAVKYTDVLWKILGEIDSLLSIIIAFVITWALTNAVEKNIQKSNLDKKSKQSKR